MFGLFSINGKLIQDGFYSAKDASDYAQAELNLAPGSYTIKKTGIYEGEYYEKQSI